MIGNAMSPPLSESKLAEYKNLFADLVAGSPVRVAIDILVLVFETWQNLPVSTGNAVMHPAGLGAVITLDPDISDTLAAVKPRKRQLAEMSTLFDSELDGPVRNAAFHLLWYAKEIDLDREPMTTDLLARLSPG